MARLCLENVTLERAGRVILRGFSAEIDSGQALKIQGSNGSGKTSLLRALAGLLRPIEGKILWNGEPLTQQCRPDGGRIVFVGHQEGIKLGLTVRENLKFWSGLMGLAVKVEDIGVDLNLGGLLARPVRQLSAGQRRRVALSRLFIGEWEMWLLDEPTNALDAATRRLLIDRVNQHLQKGGLAVISSHDGIDAPGPCAHLDIEGQ